MSKILRNLGFAAVMAVAASALTSNQASALSISECSAKFKAAKAAGTEGGLKWNDFRKAQCSADAAPAVQVAPAATKVAAPAAPAPAAAAGGMTMKECSVAWKALKAAKGVPAGMKWQDFLAAKCVVEASAPAAAPAAPAGKVAAPAVAPAAPAAGKVAAPAVPVAGDVMLDKKGKPMSPGRAAMVKRERACGTDWKALKASNKVPVGLTWPQFWSKCNKEKKAQGL